LGFAEDGGSPCARAAAALAAVIGFEADEPDERGHKVIRLFVEEPDPRPGTQRPMQGQQEGRGRRHGLLHPRREPAPLIKAPQGPLKLL
jgi:hypothetical protein